MRNYIKPSIKVVEVNIELMRYNSVGNFGPGDKDDDDRQGDDNWGKDWSWDDDGWDSWKW
jgi:hypothetical protein